MALGLVHAPPRCRSLLVCAVEARFRVIVAFACDACTRELELVFVTVTASATPPPLVPPVVLALSMGVAGSRLRSEQSGVRDRVPA